MFNPSTLSKMAEYKHQDMHRQEALRQLKNTVPQKESTVANTFSRIAGFIRHQLAKSRQTPPEVHLLERAEEKR